MTDIVRKKGDIIDLKALSKSMGCEVVEISALKGEGCKEVTEKAIELARKKATTTPVYAFSDTVEKAIKEIEGLIEGKVDNSRWYAVKLFERDKNVIEKVNLSHDVKGRIENIIVSCEKELDDDSESIIANERYNYIGGVTKICVQKKNQTNVSTSDRIDNIVTNRFLALPIFALIMFLVYYVSISTIGTLMTDWVNDVLFGEIIPGAVGSLLESMGTAEWLNSLILDGIISGVGAVLGFLPQMLVLFFFLGFLEDSGYMARVAFIMDRLFRKFGLSGKSIIPMLVGSGCSVPGIMASRTIENEHDRKMSIMTTSFIPCSAKMPVIALIIGAMFPAYPWLAPGAYFVGVAAVLISGVILKKTKAFSGDVSPFVMELPPYKAPNLKNLLIHVWDRGKSFIRKAGTIIFLASGFIWFVSSFNWSLEMVDATESILASVGSKIAVVFSPLGWGDWKAAVAALSGLVAKENIVSTLGILYGFQEVAEDGAEKWVLLSQTFTQVSAISFLIFNLLCAPCVAAIGAIRREMGNMKWTLIAVGYQTGLAYVVSLIIYQLGTFFNGGGFHIGTAVAITILALMIYLMFRPQHGKNAKSKNVWKGAVKTQGG